MSRNCAISLQGHVPWVRHPDQPQSLEEDWFHSSVLETYLPLLDVLFRLREENIPWELTLTLSSTLLAMMENRLMKRRTLSYIDRTIRLCAEEVERGDQTGFRAQASVYLERLQHLRGLYFGQWQGDILNALRDLRDSGHLEITASAATNGLLPLLMRTPEAVLAQVRTGIRQYVQSFGRMPRGFFLPECAYAPALSRLLKKEGLEWTMVEEHGLTQSPHADGAFPYVPGRTSDGLIVFGRDHGSSSQVWSADEGYPGDERYRDFIRDVGLEAPMENLKQYLGGSGQRQFTGLKYFRASRNGNESELYDFDLAATSADEHAAHFVSSRGAQLAALEASAVEDPIVVCAFDADLFGHWWYEGTEFLEQVFRKAATRGDFQFTTPSHYIAGGNLLEKALPQASPVSSSWGEGGYFETWMTPENNWIYPELQKRADQLRRMVEMLEENMKALPDAVVELRKRCLSQMTRELLLAQSSDWAFLMRTDASRPYAETRTRQHLANFDEVRAIGMQFSANDRLDELEKKTPIFPDIPWNIFEPYEDQDG